MQEGQDVFAAVLSLYCFVLNLTRALCAEAKEAHRQEELEGKALKVNPALKHLVRGRCPADTLRPGARPQGWSPCKALLCRVALQQQALVACVPASCPCADRGVGPTPSTVLPGCSGCAVPGKSARCVCERRAQAGPARRVRRRRRGCAFWSTQGSLQGAVQLAQAGSLGQMWVLGAAGSLMTP